MGAEVEDALRSYHRSSNHVTPHEKDQSRHDKDKCQQNKEKGQQEKEKGQHEKDKDRKEQVDRQPYHKEYHKPYQKEKDKEIKENEEKKAQRIDEVYYKVLSVASRMSSSESPVEHQNMKVADV